MHSGWGSGFSWAAVECYVFGSGAIQVLGSEFEDEGLQSMQV